MRWKPAILMHNSVSFMCYRSHIFQMPWLFPAAPCLFSFSLRGRSVSEQLGILGRCYQRLLETRRLDLRLCFMLSEGNVLFWRLSLGLFDSSCFASAVYDCVLPWCNVAWWSWEFNGCENLEIWMIYYESIFLLIQWLNSFSKHLQISQQFKRPVLESRSA